MLLQLKLASYDIQFLLFDAKLLLKSDNATLSSFPHRNSKNFPHNQKCHHNIPLLEDFKMRGLCNNAEQFLTLAL